MKNLIQLAILIASGISLLPAHADNQCPHYLNQEVQLLRSDKTINLCDTFSGKPLLVINTASHCGFTPQFKGLERIYQTYQEQGLAVIGFPSNDFRQEAATQEQTAKICYINYGVTFTMTAPTKVTGDDANPLFTELANQTRAPQWNFNKYLISADRAQVLYFDSRVAPDAPELARAIKDVL